MFNNNILVKQEVMAFSLQFLCLKNIRAFLHACVNNFGLKESVLFDAHELYDVSDFHKVKSLIWSSELCF